MTVSTQGSLANHHSGEPSPTICIVGPLPPPSGGMANQCEQLVRLLREEALVVEVVRTNRPDWPAWVGRVPIVRTLFRLAPFLLQLWQTTERVQLMHIFANSGWAWHLLAAPAMVIARLRHKPVIVNYHGGNADQFLAHTSSYVPRMLARAALRVTPSGFLQRVFSQYGLSAEVIPNVVDLSRFAPAAARSFGDAPHIVVTRHLEAIYDIATAIRAFARVKRLFPRAQMTVAGSGPELPRLQALVTELALQESVLFCGRIDNAKIPLLYASADCVLNSSTVDNMPISILEAFASGVPVVSTSAGGIPDMLEHGVSGLLVPTGDDEAMAREVIRLLSDASLAAGLRQAALAQVQQYAWQQVRTQWLGAYRRAAAMGRNS